ncbi:MAG: M24 family metallopeptidase [Burkholderiales bacterium]
MVEPRLQALIDQDYPRFSGAEFARRRRALGDVMERHDCDCVLVCGENRAGTGVQWLTGWPVTTEAIVLFASGERELMHVEWYNHWPLARRIACDTDVRWGEHQGVQKTVAELRRRGARRVGIIGPLAWAKIRALAEGLDLVDLNAEYPMLRMRKSDEEIDWMRIGAYFSDLGIAALQQGARPGMTERELGDLVERAYVRLGGTTMIHYIGVNSMSDPGICVPPQIHSNRRIAAGDMLFAEITAFFCQDSPGQVLRTFAVQAEPTPLFRALHATAEAAFDAITGVLRDGVTVAEILRASALIEEAGFTVYDDVVHGFGGGYWQPIIGSKSRPGPAPLDMRLEANMTVVVQPNVVTRDQSAGVQVGELVRVTRTGFERLHRAPRGFLPVG